MISDPSRCDNYHHGSFGSLFQDINSDIKRFMNKSEANRVAPDDCLHRFSAFFTPQILAQTIHRLSHCLYKRKMFHTATLLSRLNAMLHKLNIPAHACIGPALHIPHPCGVTFCGSAGEHCTLYSLATCGADIGYADGPLSQSPVLGDRITIAAHEALLGPMRIADDVKTGLFLFRMDFDVPEAVIVSSRSKRPKLHHSSIAPETFIRPEPEVSIQC